MTDWFSVIVDVVSPHADRLDPTDEGIDELVRALTDHHGTVAASGGVWSVRVSVQATDAPAAARQAAKLVTSLGRAAGMPRWPAAHVSATREDLLDRGLARSALPELVGPSEVAAMLGVSRQRVHQLATEHRRFPPPLVRLCSGPLWLGDAIRAFAATWERKPGRPRTAGREGAGGSTTRSGSGQEPRSPVRPSPSTGHPTNGARPDLRHSDAGPREARERLGAADKRAIPVPASWEKPAAKTEARPRRQPSRRRWLLVESGDDLPRGVIVGSFASESAAGRAAAKRRLQTGAVDTQWHIYRDDDPALADVSTVEELLRRRRTSVGERGPVGAQ